MRRLNYWELFEEVDPTKDNSNLAITNEVWWEKFTEQVFEKQPGEFSNEEEVYAHFRGEGIKYLKADFTQEELDQIRRVVEEENKK